MEDGKADSLKPLLLIFLVSLIVRLLFGVLVMGLGAAPLDDAAAYDQIATNLIEKHAYIQYHDNGVWYSFRAPVLPFLLAGLYSIFGHSLAASRLLMILIGSLLPPAAFILTRHIFGRRAALVAGLIAALYPHFILYSNLLLTEAPLTLLVVVAMIFLVRFGRRGRMSDLALAGVMTGLGCLTKAPLLSFLPVAALWILIVGRARLARSAWGGILFLAVTAAVISPWTYRNYLVHGEFVPISTLGGLSLWYGNNQWSHGNLGDDYLTLIKLQPNPGSTKETDIDRFFRKEAVTFIRTHPKASAVLAVKKMLQFWRPEGFRIPGLVEKTPSAVRFVVGFASYMPLFLLFLAGLVVSLRGLRLVRDSGIFLLALLIATFTVLHAVFPSVPRYRQPIEPAIIAFASWMLVALYDRVRRAPAGELHTV
jgi:4-amino-4-deoxy-L-arabinose transferase-like glycosyltransferase